jgi:hypothetical protein
MIYKFRVDVAGSIYLALFSGSGCSSSSSSSQKKKKKSKKSKKDKSEKKKKDKKSSKFTPSESLAKGFSAFGGVFARRA